jgi:hypothetical protein
VRKKDVQETSVRHAAPEYWHRASDAIALGCAGCPERWHCGGLSINAPIFNCLDLCCKEPDKCTRYICPQQPDRYSVAVTEVGGFTLVPHRGRIRAPKRLPSYVPCLMDRGSLAGPLDLPVVAISLYRILNTETGLPRFESRSALLRHYRVHGDSRLVITATGKDRDLERFWTGLSPRASADALNALEPDLIATPNFSLHCDTVRHDNLVSMSRIAYCFSAFANAGLRTALHVNGRTPHDFSRWAKYVNASPGIRTLAYEFGTGGKSLERQTWHVDQLVALAASAGRPLDIIVQGGWRFLPTLASVFRQVTFLDTTALMKARHRQIADMAGNAMAWESQPTAPGDCIDSLFVHNVRMRRSAVLARMRRGQTVVRV